MLLNFRLNLINQPFYKVCTVTFLWVLNACVLVTVIWVKPKMATKMAVILNDVIHRTPTAPSYFFPFGKMRVRSIDHIQEYTRIWKTWNNTGIFVRLTCYSNSGIKWIYCFKDDKWNNDVIFLASQLVGKLWRRSSVTISLHEGNEENKLIWPFPPLMFPPVILLQKQNMKKKKKYIPLLQCGLL